MTRSRIVRALLVVEVAALLLVGAFVRGDSQAPLFVPPPSVLDPAAGEEGGEGELLERESWFYDQRASGGGIPPGAYARARRQARGLAFRAAAADDPLAWTELGPRPISSLAYSLVPKTADGPTWNQEYPYFGQAPLSGRVSAIATHPTDSQTVYVGGAYGGVWKTENGGGSWQRVFDNGGSLAIGALAIDPNDPDTVYAGTGEANFASSNADEPYLSAGLYKSENAGGLWAKVSSADVDFDPCYFADLAVKPGDSNTILAAVHGTGRWFLPDITACSKGIYRSTNGGANWTRATSGNGRPADLVVDPTNAAVWYAGFSNGFGVFKSTNSGESWSASSTGLPLAGCPSPPNDPNDPDDCDVGRIALAIAADGQRLYAAVEKSTNRTVHGIYTSANGGGQWSAVPAGVSAGFCNPRQCNYNLVLAVAPGDASVFYAGGVQLFRYTGFGNTFGGAPIGYGDTVTPNSIHVDFHALAFDAAGRLWIGNDGGLYRRETNGSLTNLNGGLGIVQFYPGISGKANERLFGGSQDNGMSAYSGGLGWTNLLGADGGYTAVHPFDRSVIYGTTQQLAVYKSTDGGATMRYAGPNCSEAWLGPLVNDDCPAVDAMQFITPFVMHPNPVRANWLFGGTTRLWRSKTGGRPWEQVSPQFSHTISAIAISARSMNTIYVGTANGAIRVTTTGESTNAGDWTTASGLPGKFVTDIAIHDGVNDQEAYATVSGFGTGHVFKTTNRGVNWTDISGAGAGRLPDVPVNAIAIDRKTSPATLYVAADVGVFSSTDGGVTWIDNSAGLPKVVVTDLLLDRSSGLLVAATYGRGMFSSPLPTITPAPANDAFAASLQLTGSTGTRSGDSNQGATTQANEPYHAGNNGGASVWYRWTAPGSGQVTLDTATSTFDTLLGVYTGTTLDGVTEIAANDDDPAGGGVSTSKLTFGAVAGTTYLVAVDGYDFGFDASEGSITLHWSGAADTTAPTNPTLGSTSHTVNVQSTDPTVDVTWTGASDVGSGVDGFSYEWSTSAGTVPDQTKEAEETANATTSPSLSNGSHWFHLRTRDNAGNWSAAAHLGPFVISRFQPPPPPPAQCRNGIDDDGDGLVDWPVDPGCASLDDDDEFNTPPIPPPPPACADGGDNDGDGLADWPADPGCASAADGDEFNVPPPPPAVCADGRDNDDDGLVDLTDPGCFGPTDNDEFNRTTTGARCRVPNVKGKTLPKARSALGRAGCTLGRVSFANSNRVPKGRVISQSRRPGATLPARSRVNVVVSRGRKKR